MEAPDRDLVRLIFRQAVQDSLRQDGQALGDVEYHEALVRLGRSDVDVGVPLRGYPGYV
jgi:hypothetical protein